jgi:hypothetical protein
MMMTALGFENRISHPRIVPKLRLGFSIGACRDVRSH